MKLIDVSCPHCGAGLTVTDNAKTIHCEYCNHDFLIDDEAIHISHRIEDAEQLGYDLEAGRHRFKSEAEAREGRMTDVTCPLCGCAFFADSAERTVDCPYCKQEVNVQQAIAFGKAVWYDNTCENIGDLENAKKWYDEDLKYEPDNKRILKARDESKNNLTLNYIIVGILIIAIVLFLLKVSTTAGVGLIIILLICAVLVKSVNGSDSGNNAEAKINEGNCSFDDYTDYNNFPAPDFSCPSMVPDSHTCMAKVEENEELAVRARACGKHDLAEQYENVANRWRYLHEDAEDEEVEW